MAWWGWMLVGWVGVSAIGALLVSMVIREADRRELEAPAGGLPHPEVAFAADVAARKVAARGARQSRRRIPVPPLAVTLAGIGVTLEAIGLVARASGFDRGAGQLWSMDAPMSIPRLYVTALFVAAALAAFLGSSRAPGRRGWWVGVGLVAVVIAEVKGGGTVHVRALEVLGVSGRPVAALIGSAAVAAVVLGTLWWLSRSEVRDRRRVLGAFALYAIASVGLSSVSAGLGSAHGSAWAAAATFVEESGEVLGGVAVLVAVLVGVAPRLVLPASWPLRRTADAETVDAPGTLPAWAPPPEHPRL
jgi:hypothetical protein